MATMEWTYDAGSTKAVKGLFQGYRPKVTKSGSHYRFDESPYGRIEIISMHGWFLIAADSPPTVPPPAEFSCLSKDIVRHLQHEKPPLVPWKIVPGTNLRQVLLHLKDDGPDQTSQALAPYVIPYEAPDAQPLVGEDRLAAATQLAGLITAEQPGAPLPAVTGRLGIGKHRLADAAAELLNLNPLELPLRRVLVPRILQTPSELFLEVIVAAQGLEDTLIMVSDAELLTRVPSPQRQMFLTELSHVPRVVLLITQPPEVATEGLMPMACPALATVEETRQLLAAAYPDLEIIPQALDMAVRGATVPGVGILPGRLLHLVNLGLSLGGAADPPVRFTPDDAAPAAPLVKERWTVRDNEADTD